MLGRATRHGSFLQRALVGPTMRKRAILFDIDGTLVDSNDAHVDAWQQAFAAEGYAFSRLEIHAQVGKGGDNLVPSLLPDVSTEIQERIARAEGDIYKRDYLPRVEPFAGAKEVLRHLVERGHTIVLASSASRMEVDHYVRLLDAGGLLSGTTSKDDVARSKPCPDIFTAALAQTGGPPESAIVVGDTPYDILAARRAGIDAIAVLSGGFEEQELRFCGPLAIYRGVADLRANYDSSPLSDLHQVTKELSGA
jgi:HAD superfamily hydrolase (TIGR01509 family)